MNTELEKHIHNITQALDSVVCNGPTRYALDASWNHVKKLALASVAPVDQTQPLPFKSNE